MHDYPTQCPACAGEFCLSLLGQLGRRVHCRCVNCGADTSYEVEDPVDDFINSVPLEVDIEVQAP